MIVKKGDDVIMKQSVYDSDKKVVFDEPKTYAVKHMDDAERLSSQSGGVFAALSDIILECGGVVYGCAFDDMFKAVHIRAEKKIDRNKMRYSKYVQSDMGDIFKLVLSDLKEGRTVLFSGTPCQVGGINTFIKNNKSLVKGTFYTVDIVCHGVPSPKVWRDYLLWETGKAKASLAGVVCRNKVRYGWKSHVTTLRFKNGKTINSMVFPKLFYSHLLLRPSCFRCPYKDTHHPSDISIADYWGIDKACPGFKDEKGVSLVLLNNSSGEELFSSCNSRIIAKKTQLKDSLQKPLIEPYNPPHNRSQFWKDYYSNDFGTIAKKYGDYSFYKLLKGHIKRLIKKHLKN